MQGLLISAVVIALFTSAFIGCDGGRQTAPSISAAVPAAKSPRILSGWDTTEPETDAISGEVTQFMNTGGSVHIHACFRTPRPCEVPVSIHAPKGCFIESNVEGEYTNYKRRIRLRFDDDKPQTQIWGIDDSHDAIIPHNSKQFIESVRTHKILHVDFGCASYDSEVMTIPIANWDMARAKIATHLK